MTETRGVTFTEQDNVATDGVAFIDCAFQGANLVYSGGDLPRFERCRFSKASWDFAGPALRTIELLRAINASPGSAPFIAELLGAAPAPTAARSF